MGGTPLNNDALWSLPLMRTRVIQVDPGGEFAGKISPAVRAMRAGSVVGFPTETVYGVGVVATKARAVERLRKLKQRPQSAFTIHLASAGDARRYVSEVPLRAATLMRKAWPGPLTMLLPTGGRFADPALRSKALFKRVCAKAVVGLRCPADAVARLLLKRVGKPVLASSANLAGGSAARTADEALVQLDGRIELLVDAGPTRYGGASTIVAFAGEAYEIVRAGVYDAGSIGRMASRTVLFVCSGNTCRSPMAAAVARKLLAERLGCSPEELEGYGQEVVSAGTLGSGDAPATKEAAEAARRLGATLGKHCSRRLSNELIQAADLIFCMSRQHVDDVIGRAPASAGKTFLLDAEGDIADPIGGDTEKYVGVAGRIERSLRKRMKENLL